MQDITKSNKLDYEWKRGKTFCKNALPINMYERKLTEEADNEQSKLN